MFFTLEELVFWLRMTAFELWLQLVSVLLFSVLAVLKYEDVLPISWWRAFIPLFTCDGLSAYFCVIVFIRQYMREDIKVAFLRFLASGLSIVLLFLFKLLLCQRLSGQRDTSVSEVMGPMFVLLQIVMVRACRTHWVLGWQDVGVGGGGERGRYWGKLTTQEVDGREWKRDCRS